MLVNKYIPKTDRYSHSVCNYNTNSNTPPLIDKKDNIESNPSSNTSGNTAYKANNKKNIKANTSINSTRPMGRGSPSCNNSHNNNSSNYHVLEIGAGVGNITSALTEIFPKANITAIEMEALAINYFKQNLPNIAIKQGYLPYNLPQLNFKPNVIFLIAVLEHVKEHKEALSIT